MNKITRDETEHGVEYVRADEAQAEVLEQCRIIAMGAEREDALRAELTRLKASIALDKMAENARDLGLDYEPAVQERNFCERCGKRLGGDGHIHTCTPPAAQPAVQEPVAWVNHGENRITRATGWDGYGALCKCVCANPPAAQPAVQEGRDWSLLEATQESLREHMAEIKRLKAAQPAQKPWVGLTDEEKYEAEEGCSYMDEFYRSLYADNIEAKLKEKNHA
jgi:hypothetical protein